MIFLVEGIASGECELKIQNRLAHQGINHVKADFHSSSLHVEYDPSVIALDEIKTMLLDSGYRIVGERPLRGKYEGRDDAVE